MNEFWKQDLSIIPGISTKGIESFEKLNIHNLYDLIWHLPINYEDRRCKSIAFLKKNFPNLKKNLIVGKIIERQYIKSNKSYWRFLIEDETGTIQVLLFNLPFYLVKKLTVGCFLECFGSLSFSGNQLVMVHPKFSIINASKSITNETIQNYQSVYQTTKTIPQSKIKKAIDFCLIQLKIHPIFDYLDDKFNLPNLSDSLLFLHKPPIKVDIEKIYEKKEIKRLVVYEICHLVLSSKIAQLERKKIQAQSFLANPLTHQRINQLTHCLDFELNQDQNQCVNEVLADLSKPVPMQRLIQGDVGSGKTIVSAFCALSVLSLNYKVALLAPTEVLAHQHYQSFKKWYESLSIAVFFLSRSTKAKEKREIEKMLLQEKPCILIGTHLIFQKTIQFKKLGLVIIDEPQRFGVIQRLNLLAKGKNTHQLLLSATPIPRTLAQSLYADLDVSQIKQKPKNRQGIDTVIFNRKNINELIARVNNIVERGEQVYWVCPRIDFDDESNLVSTEAVYRELSGRINHPIALIHGKLKNEEKNQIIDEFHQQKIKLLVSTTIIEVGIDSPNASVIVIENASNLGLSSLHQLRGRVARGEKKGYCVLLYDEFLSQHQKNRLEMIKNNNDGFVIAEYDLKTRGAGDLFGVVQSGSQIWNFFKMPEDEFWLNQCKSICENWLNQDYQEAFEYLKQRSGDDRISIHQVK